MATLVATINGRKVFSNKSVNSIVNTRVTFSDGSWCDVATGEVHNNGAGYINFDTPSASDGGSEKTTIGPKSFQAKAVDIRDVSNAAINVQPYDGSEVVVTLEGTAEALKAIKLNQQGDDVVIEGESSNGGGGMTIISGGGNSSVRIDNIRAGNISIGGGTVIRGGNVISGNNIVVKGSSSEPEAKITVKVPRKTTVRLSGDYAEATVGDTEGAVNVNANGVGPTNIGSVGNARLKVSGTGNINVRRVSGSLKVTVTGTASVRVNDGEISELEANVSGVGSAHLNVSADEADLNLSGVGNIYVKNVKARPIRHQSGMGSIQVGNW